MSESGDEAVPLQPFDGLADLPVPGVSDTCLTSLLSVFYNGKGSITQLDGHAAAVRFDFAFLRRVWKLHKVAFPRWRCRETLGLVSLLAFAVLKQIVIYFFGLVPSMFYAAFDEHTLAAFLSVVPYAIGVCVAVTLVNSAVLSTAGLCAAWSRRRVCVFLNDAYMRGNRFFLVAYGENAPDNPDQRLTQDADELTRTLGVVYPRLLITPFVIIFYTYKTYITMGWQGPVSIYLFYIVATAVNQSILSPIVPYVFLQERLEGDYRTAHARVRRDAECIALSKGQENESHEIQHLLDVAVSNQTRIVLREVFLNISTQFFTNFGAVLSYFVIAVPMFASASYASSGGDSSSSAAATAATVSATSFFSMYLINSFSEFLNLSKDLTTIAGLTGRVDTLQQALSDIDPSPDTGLRRESHNEESVALANVSVSLPSGLVLLERLSFSVERGEGLLISGPSGSGKTTLVRAIAGIWQHAEGVIRLPLPAAAAEQRPALFVLPQSPYVSPGTLTHLVTYPHDASDADDEAAAAATNARVRELLDRVGLGHVVHREGGVAVSRVWANILSPGEQQRLCFARVLWHRPLFAVLDESSSALDTDTEEELYGTLATAGVTPISVGHRASLRRYHSYVLKLSRDGSFDVEQL